MFTFVALITEIQVMMIQTQINHVLKQKEQFSQTDDLQLKFS